MYCKRNSNQHRRLQVFETGSEDFMTGGWMRVLASAEQVRKERAGNGAGREGGSGDHPRCPPRRAAGGVPRRSLGLSRRRKAPVGSSCPSACHGCAVACIGQPPPPSALGPGPCVGLLARFGARGCGGAAHLGCSWPGFGPVWPRAAARAVTHFGPYSSGVAIASGPGLGGSSP